MIQRDPKTKTMNCQTASSDLKPVFRETGDIQNYGFSLSVPLYVSREMCHLAVS